MAAPPRGGRQQLQQPQTPKQTPPKWWRFVCAVAYELRPFTPPTRHDVRQFYHSTRQTLRVLGTEGAALARAVTTAAATHLTWRRLLAVGGYAGLQWAAARVEFGVVFFILAMLGLIFTVGLGDDASRRGRGGERLSPWSVFNQGMRSILGTLDPAQFEAELRNYDLGDGGLGEQLLLRRGQGDGGDGGGGGEGEQQHPQQQQQGGPARKSGKKARRKYEERRQRRRRQGAGGGLGAAGGGGGGGGAGEELWEEDWVSDDED